ncbi:AsmA family protein [Legionella sp. CNM-4043-24]|uniref:AsmA family protein n=1 Tax=Legionella sp. CNM-4043-24 TaxID=3421646 RepID=UPI00403AA084
MKLIKKLLAASLLLLLISSLSLWILSRTIKPEVLREYVSSQLSAISSQPSQINGDIHWQIFPQPGIKITDVEVGNENSKSDYFLHMNNLQFNLKITPLLRGRLVFNDIDVKGFRARINTDAPLNTNTAVKKTGAASSNPFGEQLAIDRLMLSQGQVILQSREQQVKLSNLQIGAEHINLESGLFPFQLKSGIEYQDQHKKLFSSKIQFKGYTLLSTALLRNPAAQLQSARLTGQLDIQNLRSAQIKIAKIHANTSFRQGILQLNPLTINLYEGQSIGDLRYELSEKNLQINQTASALNSSRMTLDIFGKTLIKGKLDMSLHAQIDTGRSNWQATALGSGNISVKDGSLEAVDLNKIIAISSEKINKLLIGLQPGMKLSLSGNPLNDPQFFSGNSPFKLLSIPYHLDNNTLHSEDLLLQMDNLQVKGDTQLNLNDYALLGHLRATVLIEDKKINKIQQLLGGYFPLLVKDTATNPSVIPDFSKINPVLTKAWLGSTLTRPVRSIADSVASFLPK